MGSLYNPTKPTSFIMEEVDANNLYGWAMSQAMPDGDFEWLNDSECREIKHRLINVVKQNKIFGQNWNYIFEVDINYSQELHKRDDDYPLAPELMTIDAEITCEKSTSYEPSILKPRARLPGNSCVRFCENSIM